MKQPLIALSIIVPTYNRSKLLAATLLSITKQTTDLSVIEVIVVDDGSTDDTLEVIRAFNDKLKVEYCYQEDKGYCVASARNLGIHQAVGEVILFVDAGVLLSNHCVQAHLDSHISSPYDAVVIGYILGLQEEEDEKQYLVNLMQDLEPNEVILFLLDKNINLDLREDIYSRCASNIHDLPAPWVLFWTGNASVKRKRILEVGLFDTNFDGRWGIEDVDLGYRLYKNHLKFKLNRMASSIHYPHFSDSKLKLEQEHHNKLYFHKKYNTLETETLLTENTVSLNFNLMLRGK